MKVINELFEKKNIGQLMLGIVMIIYLIVGYKMPCFISNFINTPLGVVVFILMSIILVFKLNPIIGVLSIFVVYEIIQRAKKNICESTTQLDMPIESLSQFAPKEKYVQSPFNINNQFIPITLEQEIVEKMAPICSQNSIYTKATYTPLLENIYNSAPIDYKGVI